MQEQGPRKPSTLAQGSLSRNESRPTRVCVYVFVCQCHHNMQARTWRACGQVTGSYYPIFSGLNRHLHLHMVGDDCNTDFCWSKVSFRILAEQRGGGQIAGIALFACTALDKSVPRSWGGGVESKSRGAQWGPPPPPPERNPVERDYLYCSYNKANVFCTG